MWKDKIVKNGGNTWWWNKELKDAITSKKDTYKTLCKNRSADNRKNTIL